MNAKQRDRVKQLTRRRDHLAERIRNYQGRNASYDKAECYALTWALQIIRAADREDVLADLERVAV